MKVTASDADDPTYGSSARVVYSVLEGETFFTVDRHTGKSDKKKQSFIAVLLFLFFMISVIHPIMMALASVGIFFK